MGKKAKIGKARKDKFYQLAKETGYRARSSFKLLQLNRKFGFLQKSRVLIDLCAAPGSWCQVAAQHMPVSSNIVGVDLVPIKPMPGVVTLVHDITTDTCRQALKKELHDWKADVVLNDGAPNVGSNWIHDAFTQSQLTLQAMKLATEFLRKGGWFITKVFRSADYHALMWVFKQLFKKVHATKPQASRNESAEIFVVCEGFLAPDRIDPKFTDPKHIFKEVEAEEKTNQLNLIHPEKHTRQREGYAEGDFTLHHSLKASDFITSTDHLDLLAGASEIILDDKLILLNKLTTVEIKACCEDIKVLGRKEVKSLLTWRVKIRKWLDAKANEGQEKDEEKEDKEESDSESEEAVAQKLKEIKEAEEKDIKKKRKKVMKEKRKLRDKLQLKMVIPGDKMDMNDDNVLFDLAKIKSKKGLHNIESGDTDGFDAPITNDDDEDDDSDDDDLIKKRQTVAYNRHADNDYLGEEDDQLEFQTDSEAGEESDEEEDGTAQEENPLLMDLEDDASKVKNNTDMWFSKDVFSGLDVDEDEDLELKRATQQHKKKGGVIIGQEDDTAAEEETPSKKSKKTKTKQKQTPKPKEEETNNDNVDESDSDSSDSDSEDNDSDYDINIEMTGQQPKQQKRKASNKDGFEIVSASGKIERLDPLELAIGEEMVKSKKRRREILEESYNRYTFNDPELPGWFVTEEAKHRKRQMPVTKEQIAVYKEKMRAVDARPIKKIAEAKGRKKIRAVKKLEKARKKSDVISETVDVGDKEKWAQIKAVYKRAGLLNKKEKNTTYVVAKQGTGKKVSRPAGVKGRFKVVDPRMKKDNMRKKSDAKSQRKKGKQGGKKDAKKSGKKGKR